MIREQVELEAQIIDDLLDLTRIGQGRLTLHPQVVDAHDLLREALAAVSRDIHEKQLDLRLDLRATCNRLTADPRRIRQVFWNLLSNAVKFTPAGGTITVRTDDAPGCQFHLTVTDTGIGFRPDVATQLFRPFEQVEQSLTRRFGGLGLGLTIAKELVDLHHGTIAAASPGPDRGATFTLLLPAAPGAPAAAAAAAPPAGLTAARPLDILLVEDNPQTRTAMARILQHAGHRVHVADAIAPALRALEDQPVDLLVCDIGLPDGSGWELLRRATTIRTGVPAIALSGFGSDQDLDRSRRAGFAAHLIKPVTPQKLLEAIQRATVPGGQNSHTGAGNHPAG
jgi:CheY-like chemotaxis protein